MAEYKCPVGADVEIIEAYTTRSGVGDVDGLPCIKPTHVRVNGTDVGLVKKGSIVVEAGCFPDQETTVTLTLLVKSLTIKAE